jgi:hypothetical protein
MNHNLYVIRSIWREQISHKAGLRQPYMLSIRNLKTRESLRAPIRAPFFIEALAGSSPNIDFISD